MVQETAISADVATHAQQEGGPVAPRPRLGPGWTLVAIALAAAALRFSHLADKSFWFDEGFSIGVARLGWNDFFQLMWRREMNMLPYYLLLKGWLWLGSGEFFVRSLSGVAGLATLPAIYVLGRRLFDARVGLTAAMLLAVNAYHVRYSQEARSYALTVLLAVVSCYALVRSVESGRRHHWGWYAVITALMVYSHFYALLVVAAQWASLPMLIRQRFDWRGALRAARLLALLLLPIAIPPLLTGLGVMSFVSPVTAGGLWWFVQLLCGGGGVWLVAIYAVLLISAGLAAAKTKAWSSQAGTLQGWSYVLLLSWLVLPAVLLLAVSQYRPLFLGRYLLPSLPALALLAALGLWRLRPRLLRMVVLLALAALSLRGVAAYYERDFDLNRDDWRAASQYLLANSQPGDAVFFYTAPGRMPFEYYRWLAGRPQSEPLVIYPAHAPQSSWRDFVPEPLAEVLPDVPVQPRRVWLVLNQHMTARGPDMGSDVMRAWYGQRYQLTAERNFAGIEVVLYEK